VVGRAAMRAIVDGLPIRSIAAVGESLPFPDGSVDVVYTRATLHHVRELDRFAAECARVLRSGGTFVACREHVAESPRELDAFLANHPLHRLAGGEHAYPLRDYVGAIVRSGLRIEATLGPWDSVINAFPAVRSEEELRDLVPTRLRRRLGPRMPPLAALRLLGPLLEMWIKRPTPGRLYSFVAKKA
jgi:SAM-dependent methyltransferase